MKITIYGCGYVGLVTGACLSELGHEIVCIDINQERIGQLNRGIIPIYEPGLEKIVTGNMENGRLSFSVDPSHGVNHGLVQIIAVDTPMSENGSANINSVMTVAKTIAAEMEDYRLIINKSTAPVGTANKIREIIEDALKERNVNIDFDIASNPEFLKEGSAVKDFMEPDRIIIGIDQERPKKLFEELYDKFIPKILFMDVASAELTKYTANAMLATRISFINEISNIAEAVGADIEEVRRGIGTDPRIGSSFIAAGCGYGGTCFPKDVKALAYQALDYGIQPRILNAIALVNQEQKQVLIKKILKHFHLKLSGLTFAIWGLSFKPNTNDLRDATSHVIMDALWTAEANVRAYDPVAIPDARELYGQKENLTLCQNAFECLEDADALIIVTEWDEFKSMTPNDIRSRLKTPVVFDGRNIFDPAEMKKHGIDYFSIGR